MDFEEKRKPKKKRMPGENAKDESRQISTVQNYKLIYFRIADCVRTSIEKRFVPNEDILKDCSWLDPEKFNEIATLDSFPDEVLVRISKLCKVGRSVLLVELKQFADQYKSFMKVDEMKNTKKQNKMNSDEDDGSTFELDEENSYVHCSEEQKCSKCLLCAFFIIYELSQSGLFVNLYVAYKFVLTTPCTQVTCERVFSKLKIVKNRLRSTLGQELMSHLLFINVERDLFNNMDKDEIIDEIAGTRAELTRALK